MLHTIPVAFSALSACSSLLLFRLTDDSYRRHTLTRGLLYLLYTHVYTLTMTHPNDRHAYFIQHWIAQMTYWKVNPAAQHWRTQNAPFFLLLLLLLLVLTCAHVVSGLSHTCRYLGYPIRMYVQGRHEGGGLCQERRLKHMNSFTLEAHKVLYTEAYTSKEKGVETEHRQFPYWKHFKPATTS